MELTESLEFKIEPLKGTNLLKLGLTSDEYKHLINKKPRRIAKEGGADDYTFFHIFYNDSGKSEAIEFWEPTCVSFNGFSLMGKPYLEVEKYFHNIDKDIVKEEGIGFTSNKYQIGIYAPYDIVEGVLVARKGYYEYDDK
jgi:hypothetical protein